MKHTRTILQNLLKFAVMVISVLIISNACSPTTSTSSNGEKPNILWIYVEDINPFLSCYGVDINPTPNVDKLAENGVLFKKAFTPSPVCSPTRSGIITGMMPTTWGMHNHHTSRTVESAIFLPKGTKTIPEYFKDNGYYTFNNGKDDYNFIYNRKDLYDGDFGLQFWYTFEGFGHWRDKERGDKPFFGQIQLEGGKMVLPQPWRMAMYDSIVPPENRIDTSLLKVPPYYPDVPTIRFDWGEHYNSVRFTDSQVGHIMGQLKEDGLLENTIIFFFSDHGYKGTRHKQFCYDGGIQVPLIVAYFGENETIKKGIERNDFVNLIDVGPTSMALAGIPVPEHMEGKDVFAPGFKRDYIVSVRDRCDFTIDRIRAIRTEKFKYIKNYYPERSYQQPTYRDTRPEFLLQKEMYEKGLLNDVQAKYWGPTKPVEELYDLENDPHEIKNLAEDPNFKAELEKHRAILENWIKETGDKGEIAEVDYLAGREALRFIIDRWGQRCVSPEFDVVKSMPMPGAPSFDLKTGLSNVDNYGDKKKK
ncbi:MAG: sulfatase [Bacteroidales bacterium]|nr:sulfatase [Bacteroidales bacterium]